MPRISKKEQARIDAEKQYERERIAMRFIDEPRPEPMKYENEKPADVPWGWLMVGWSVGVWLGGFRIEQGCSSGHFHAIGRTDKTTSQYGGCFYRTKLEAAIEGRYRLQDLVAKELSRMDAFIEAVRKEGL